jgi:SAM-dependent methyltransferase
MDSEHPYKPMRITRGNIVSQIKSAYKYKGLYYIISAAPSYAKSLFFTTLPNYFWLSYYKLFRSSETFEFQGNNYHYLFHAYCPTWKNERSTVIPIVWKMIQSYRQQNKRVLEVGNTLSYVFNVDYDILDKYEIVEGVINEDAVDFNPPEQYDLIVSIFTLQLVGLNESLREPVKGLKAMQNLKRHLAPGGRMVVVHALGHNHEMDKLLKNGTMQFNRQFYLKRISRYKWKETTWDDVKDSTYDYSVPTANGVVIGIIEKSCYP